MQYPIGVVNISENAEDMTNTPGFSATPHLIIDNIPNIDVYTPCRGQ
jgi:hypothetical protein